ncbi:hypothetical protein [Pseudomonas sp. PLMAX]|uniref:hypothetical protein n=1 Tax=Pseudomonas sp. PLMAX TaxID=2201998 RepID=UPI0038BA7393
MSEEIIETINGHQARAIESSLCIGYTMNNINKPLKLFALQSGSLVGYGQRDQEIAILPRRRKHTRPAIKIDRSTLEQDKFLDLCQRREKRLTLHLEGNVQLIGVVHRHDRKSIEFGGKNPSKPPRLVAKSAVVYIQENPMVLPASLSTNKHDRPLPEVV